MRYVIARGPYILQAVNLCSPAYAISIVVGPLSTNWLVVAMSESCRVYGQLPATTSYEGIRETVERQINTACRLGFDTCAVAGGMLSWLSRSLTIESPPVVDMVIDEGFERWYAEDGSRHGCWLYNRYFSVLSSARHTVQFR
ncbi:hypothetical protein AB1N83_004728 [Pleurotus pulmonarius]